VGEGTKITVGGAQVDPNQNQRKERQEGRVRPRTKTAALSVGSWRGGKKWGPGKRVKETIMLGSGKRKN